MVLIFVTLRDVYIRASYDYKRHTLLIIPLSYSLFLVNKIVFKESHKFLRDLNDRLLIIHNNL